MEIFSKRRKIYSWYVKIWAYSPHCWASLLMLLHRTKLLVLLCQERLVSHWAELWLTLSSWYLILGQRQASRVSPQVWLSNRQGFSFPTALACSAPSVGQTKHQQKVLMQPTISKKPNCWGCLRAGNDRQRSVAIMLMYSAASPTTGCPMSAWTGLRTAGKDWQWVWDC